MRQHVNNVRATRRATQSAKCRACIRATSVRVFESAARIAHVAVVPISAASRDGTHDSGELRLSAPPTRRIRYTHKMHPGIARFFADLPYRSGSRERYISDGNSRYSDSRDRTRSRKRTFKRHLPYIACVNTVSGDSRRDGPIHNEKGEGDKRER